MGTDTNSHNQLPTDLHKFSVMIMSSYTTTNILNS